MLECALMIKRAKMSEASKKFLEDLAQLGAVSDGEQWFVDKGWSDKFHAHLDALIEAFDDGDALAAFYIGNIYSLGCLFTSQQAAVANYQADIVFATEWWIKAAQQGVAAAWDSVIAMGVGDEADRIRQIYKDHQHDFTHDVAPSEGWLADMQKLHGLVYDK